MKTRIAIAQINVTVGDFMGNLDRIVAAADEAHRAGAHLMVVPELALSGYPPEDWLLRPAFYAAAHATLIKLAQTLAQFNGLAVVVGHPYRPDAAAQQPIEPSALSSDAFNAASLLVAGRIVGTYLKEKLPNVGVFDEKRYFASDTQPFVFEMNGRRFGMLICQDIWHKHPAQRAKDAGAQVLLVINGSPYHVNKLDQRSKVVRARVHETGLPVIYANLVGGQDELVFDGASFVLNACGEQVARLPQFEACCACVEFDGATPLPAIIAPELAFEAQIYAALVLGVRDYIGKNGLPGAIIGLSGGVDSALVLAIACDALGPERVRAVMMPSRYTAEMSKEDAREMAGRVGVRYDEIAITPMLDAFYGALTDEFAGSIHKEVSKENIQARVRSTLLMALSNQSGWLVLTTSNKSEMATGYCTLYGDMAGGFAVLKDIAKTLVYRLCRYRNCTDTFATRNLIPTRVLTRPPSAELRENQTDQDSLPPYEVLDGIMRKFIEENRSGPEIVAAGYSASDVAYVTRLIRNNEYKRRQAPIGIRVTRCAFGRDWRYPVTSCYTEG